MTVAFIDSLPATLFIFHSHILYCLLVIKLLCDLQNKVHFMKKPPWALLLHICEHDMVSYSVLSLEKSNLKIILH